LRSCIFLPSEPAVSETFLKAHIERLPGVQGVIYRNNGRPRLGEQLLLSDSLLSRGVNKFRRIVAHEIWNARERMAYEAALRRLRIDVVLAEYGTMGVEIVDACRRADIPLVVHFHGYDASRKDVLEKEAGRYQELFNYSAAIVVVSRAMKRKLIELGCPSGKIFHFLYGVDCDRFAGSSPACSPPHFIAVGRFVEKKGPHLTLLAFAKAVAKCPDATLTMVGAGPLLGVCKDLARTLKIEDCVRFPGAQPHGEVLQEMQKARSFVQHSVIASDGDSEGTPVAILEASATGLPVISTRHAGIPDVVIHEKTGLLCDERDVSSMAEHMVTIATNPPFAGKLGSRGAALMRHAVTMDQSVERLARVMISAARRETMDPLQSELSREMDDALRCLED
jgi:colanic acid/amylovoran biosynthesis glycosyltransferase